MPQVSGLLDQRSYALAMKSQGLHGCECSAPVPGSTPFRLPCSRRGCLHLSLVVCLGCGPVCNRRLSPAGLSAPVVPRPSLVSQPLAGLAAATPHNLEPERGPFFLLFSSFLPPLSVKWSSPQGSREQHSLPGFLESP